MKLGLARKTGLEFESPAAPMAAVDAVMPAPPPPPPVPVARISRLALAAADAVLCLWIASLWILFASFAAVLIGRLACGWGCPVVDAAWTAVLVSLLFVAIVWPLAALLLSKFVEPFYIDQLEKVLTPTFELEIWCLFCTPNCTDTCAVLLLKSLAFGLWLCRSCGRERRRWNL